MRIWTRLSRLKYCSAELPLRGGADTHCVAAWIPDEFTKYIMSHALNGSSALQCFKHDNVVENTTK